MDRYEVLRGYVEYNNKEYPFLYENGLLNLFPPTTKEWRDELRNQLRGMHKLRDSIYINEWIRKIKLNAILNNHKEAIFIVQEDYSCDNGFIQFEVDIVYVYDKKELDKGLINSIRLKGTEINDFFNPQQVFDIDTNMNEEGLIKDLAVKTKGHKLASGGSYKVNDKIHATLEFKAVPLIKLRTSTPLDSISQIQLNFSESVDIDVALLSINQITKLFMYLCYRSNISFDSIEVFSIVDNELRKTGNIMLNQSKCIEEDKKRAKKIISYELLNQNVGKILQEISNDKLYFEHICSSIADTRSYGINRIILLFSAFEREYANIYGKTVERSDEYNSVKHSVLEAINLLKSEYTGKRKKYVSGFYKIIDRSDNSLSEKIKKSINDCIDILELFLINLYGKYDEKLIEDIADRMNNIRNDIAHGNLNLEIEPINLNDFKVIEILLYVIRLKYMGIDKVSIVKSINNQFLYNVSIS